MSVNGSVWKRKWLTLYGSMFTAPDLVHVDDQDR